MEELESKHKIGSKETTIDNKENIMNANQEKIKQMEEKEHQKKQFNFNKKQDDIFGEEDCAEVPPDYKEEVRVLQSPKRE